MPAAKTFPQLIGLDAVGLPRRISGARVIGIPAAESPYVADYRTRLLAANQSGEITSHFC